MSKAEDFIKTPHILRKLLSGKYSFSPEDYNILQIDNILFKKHFHLKIQYSDFIIINNQFEFLKRKYQLNESKLRIPKLTDFYKSYQSFFCNPFFTNWNFMHLLCKHYETKAELYYMKNYFQNDNDPILSLNKNAYQNEEDDEDSVTVENLNMAQTNTIFDDKLRAKIEKIKEVKDTIGNTLSLDSKNYSNSHYSNINTNNNNPNELYTQRSNNDSLRNIILAFTKRSYPNRACIYNTKKQMTKYAMMNNTKDKDKDKEIEIKPIRPIQLIDKSYLNKKYSNQSNSMKSMQSLIHNSNKPLAFTKLQLKQSSIASCSRNSYQNISLFRKLYNDKTLDIFTCNNNNNSTHNQSNTSLIKGKINPTLSNNNLLSTHTHIVPQTRNNSNSNVNSNITHSIFNHSNQKSISYHNLQSQSKHKDSKVLLSHCGSSLTLMKTKPKCSLTKQSHLLLPLTLHDNGHNNEYFSRNKKNSGTLQSVGFKNNNNPIIQLTTLSKMKVNNVNKATKSLDTKDNRVTLSHPLHQAQTINQNSKVNFFKEFSKGKRQSLPLSYKLTKQINDLLKYAKTSKSPNIKKFC